MFSPDNANDSESELEHLHLTCQVTSGNRLHCAGEHPDVAREMSTGEQDGALSTHAMLGPHAVSRS
jgi:hypothetical protein